jgi:hypothetical protein
VIFDLPGSLVIRDDDPPDYCPCPPNGGTRIVEAVIIATLSAVAARVVEHVYTRMFPPKESSEPPEAK